MTEQSRATVYLLDQSMGLDTVGLFSDTVRMMAVEAACAVSYRTAATTLNDLTGLNLSHESVWRIVQNAGSWEQARVDTLAVAAKAERRAGTYETPVLYEEMADVYLALQGKDRLEHGPGKEMKVSIAYSGIYKDAAGGEVLPTKFLTPAWRRLNTSGTIPRVQWQTSKIWTVWNRGPLTATAQVGSRKTWCQCVSSNWTSSTETGLCVPMWMTLISSKPSWACSVNAR